MSFFDNSYFLGILMIILGFIMKYCTGNSPNPLGLKTPTTIKNSSNWKKSNSYAGKLSIIFGIIFLLLFYYIDNFSSVNIRFRMSQLIFLTIIILIVVLTEIHLYKENKKN